MIQFNPVPKPEKSRRVKHTQRQLAAISKAVDQQLKERSGRVCELRRACSGSIATERSHTIGRRLITHKTTVDDLFHVCHHCHIWLDQTPEGIRLRRAVRECGTTEFLNIVKRY